MFYCTRVTTRDSEFVLNDNSDRCYAVTYIQSSQPPPNLPNCTTSSLFNLLAALALHLSSLSLVHPHNHCIDEKKRSPKIKKPLKTFKKRDKNKKNFVNVSSNLNAYSHKMGPARHKKVESNSKPPQLGLAQSHQFTIKKRCVRKIKSYY